LTVGGWQLAVGSWQLAVVITNYQLPITHSPFPIPNYQLPITNYPFPIPMKDLTRRQFIAVTALTAGFALAVHPISEATITTDATGLIAGEVKIPVKDGQIPAYRAMPATGSNFSVVLVIQEIFGVHAHIQDVCRRFAKLGYLAIAPEMFARQGDVSKMSDIQEIRKIVSKVPDAQVMSDLDATVDWAQKSGKGNINKLGITGFCWGGRIVWLYAAHNPKVKAGVAWYGRLVGDSTSLTPKQPIDIASTLKVPVLGLYAGKDDLIPNDTVEKMQQVLKSSSSGSEIVLYPDTPHGFHADYRPTYRKKEAEDAWKLLQDWFKKYGV
jgi:carboxymethylenebutenolidase